MDNWIIHQDIDLFHPAKAKYDTPYILMLPGDHQAHTWEITCYNNGQPADMDGVSAHAYFLRKDGITVVCEGTAEGNVISVPLIADCYAVPGGLRGAVRVTRNGKTVTLSDLPFIVNPPIDGGEIIAEGTVIPSIDALLDQISRLEQATNAAMVSLACGGLTVIRVDGTELHLGRVGLTDENAYDVAVEMGFDGTEEDWEAYIALVDENASAINEALETAQEALEAAQGVQSRSATVTVAVTDWTGEEAPYTATIPCAIATANNHLIVGIGGDITSAEQAAISQASIVCYAQGAGTISLKAYGLLPAIPITVNVLEVN